MGEEIKSSLNSCLLDLPTKVFCFKTLNFLHVILLLKEANFEPPEVKKTQWDRKNLFVIKGVRFDWAAV